VSPKRRRFSPLPLAGVSIALLLVPSVFSHKARLTVLSVFAPLRHLAASAQRTLSLPAPAGETDEARRRNAYLTDLVVKLKAENDKLQAQMEQASNVRRLASGPEVRLLQADVVLPSDSSPWRRSLTVALGTRGGARKGMLVLHNNRLVGRVVEAGPWESRVQLVTDPGFRARAVAVPRTSAAGVSFEQRHVGVYEGTSGSGGLLKWILGDTRVEDGATVLTTEDPANGVPAGLILGRVATVSRGRGPSLSVEVEPLINFRGLETVTLLGRSSDP
jgi:cell shape-determining protein MreC